MKWLILICAWGGLVNAEDKVCKLKGMVCDNCVDTVKAKLCNDSFKVCEVKVGEAHLVTRQPKQKIDVARLNNLIESTSYSVESCGSTASAKAP